MLKRLFDITFSLTGLVLLFPLFPIVIVLIKLDSSGPIFYRGMRWNGKYGNPFRIYKFRTMFANADQMAGGPSPREDDPRITKLGRSMRKYKLNELPQLINVLKGEMSFVGPRPEVEQYVKIYTEEEKLALLSVHPGITDYASIKFHNKEEILLGGPDPDKIYEEEIRPEKIRLQLEYVRTRSFWVDLKILLRTLKTLIVTRS